jgi:hypothetical protein
MCALISEQFLGGWTEILQSSPKPHRPPQRAKREKTQPSAPSPEAKLHPYPLPKLTIPTMNAPSIPPAWSDFVVDSTLGE